MENQILLTIFITKLTYIRYGVGNCDSLDKWKSKTVQLNK